MIDDEVAKKKILEYFDDQGTIDDIKIYISKYVYNYPRKVFCVEHNQAVDFYIYYMKRLDKMLNSYKITEVKFVTWLTHTLRTSYLNYIKKFLNTRKNEISEISLDKIFIDNGVESNLYNKIPSLDYHDKSEAPESLKKMNNYIKAHYNSLEALLFRMHYMEVFSFFLPHDIMTYFDLTYKEVLVFLDDARLTYIDKYQSFMKLQDRCTVILLKIIALEKDNPDSEKIKDLKYKKERYLNRLKQLRMVVPYSYLSSKFHIKVNKISKIVGKIRNDIKLNFDNFIV